MENKYKQFKCKDEIIFQNRVHFGDKELTWNYGIVNYEDEDYVHLVGGWSINNKMFKILPYEGNEHLVGTTDEPEDSLSEKEVQDAYWNNCTKKEKENLRKNYNTLLKEDGRGRSILEKVCGKHNLQDEPEEEIKLEEGERLICNNDDRLLIDGVGFLTTFSYVVDNSFFTGKRRFVNADYYYAIRFKDFNPNDMEETKKHILCVKDGKVVRFSPD